jgi:hypothetical protein
MVVVLMLMLPVGRSAGLEDEEAGVARGGQTA